MAAHDFGHLDSVRRPTGRRADYLGSLAEIRWTYGGWRDHAECLHVLAAVVVEPVNGAARNAERLPRPDLDGCSVDGPGRHALEAIDRLFVMIVTVRRRRPGAGRSGLRGSKMATLPVARSPVIKKRTASGPRRMVSSDGLT